jgi:hypothetical protein
MSVHVAKIMDGIFMGSKVTVTMQHRDHHLCNTITVTLYHRSISL